MSLPSEPSISQMWGVAKVLVPGIQLISAKNIWHDLTSSAMLVWPIGCYWKQ